jgi:hypothetical protein
VRAAAAHRSEAAFDWLLTILIDARPAVAVDIVEALAIYRHNAKLKQRLEAAIRERGDAHLTRRFAEVWQ